MLNSFVAATASAADALVDWAARSNLRSALFVALVALAAFLPGFATMPPTDRDEGRYVMATKQMVASGDYIDIRNQDEPRYKQPAGIYWMQALAVHLSGQGVNAPIGVYRLPSLLGGMLGAVLTWWAFLPLVGRRAALLAGVLVAGTILLGVEARIAKTDAALLAATMLAIGVMVRAYLDPATMRNSRLAYLFWVGIGVGVMIKGPITVLVVALGAVTLSVLDRSARWFGALRPGRGLLLVLALALPWYVAIGIQSQGEFFARAVGWNALGKVGEAHEGHGGPPGYHTALVWVLFWPAAPLLAASLAWLWANRARREVPILLCLIVPTWLFFEAVATKLPHYVLPTYPALAALLALALVDAGKTVKGWWGRFAVQGFWLVPALLGAGAVTGYVWLDGTWPVVAVPVLVFATFLGLVTMAVSLRSATAAVPLAAVTAAFTYLGVYHFVVAQLDTMWLSPRMAQAVQTAAPCPNPAIASAGFHEPSFVFLTRTDALLTGGRGAAEFLARGGCRVAFVDGAPGRSGQPEEERAFLARLAELGVRAERIALVEGRNMNGGHHRRMGLWRLVTAG